MSELKSAEHRLCEHGVTLRSVPNWQGGWNGPVSECRCCFGVFGYIDSGSWGPEVGAHGRTWTPKNLCGSCGGKYVEY